MVGPTVRSESIVYDELASAPTTCPRGWVDEQEGGTFRLRAPRRRARCSATPSATTRSSASSSRRAGRLARAARRGRRARGRASPSRRRATRSSACAPATCTRSRSRTASSSATATSSPTTRRAGATRSSSRSTAAQAGGTCFCASMGTGPRADRRLRPGADRAARRGRPPLPGRGRQRRAAPRSLAALAASRGRRAPSRPRADAAAERARGVDGPHARHHRHPRPAAGQPRAPALGRGRRPLPELRQLHARVPDVLLQHRRGHAPTSRATRPSARACGTRASRSTTPTSTAAACAGPARSRYRQWMTHKLATWIDQFGTLGLRRLRALHHLVPGGDRHHRGGGGDPRDDMREDGHADD